MEEAKKTNEKLTYEQLENFVVNLERQVSEMKKKLIEANNHIIDLNWQNMFKRLDYLFRIVENKDLLTYPIYSKAVNSIDEIMFAEENIDKEKIDKEKIARTVSKDE